MWSNSFGLNSECKKAQGVLVLNSVEGIFDKQKSYK